jgi:hypothetical protein
MNAMTVILVSSARASRGTEAIATNIAASAISRRFMMAFSLNFVFILSLGL